jgi:hypothetical protein
MGAGMLTLIGLLVVGLPFSLFEGYNEHFSKLGPREAALAEASYGAALIVLPVLVWMRFGGILPSWFPLAMLALMILGGFWLFNGAKFSVGWRDPKLIARACIKIGLAVLLFHAIGARQFGNLDLILHELLSLLGWWLLVTGITKLLLVLRGFPAVVWVDPGTPHGNAPFTNSNDAAKGLNK